MVIQHNISSLVGSTNVKKTEKKLAKNTEKLSSGYRINRSADDAAGLTISEKMRWQIRGLNRAVNNTQDGISLLQIADGALEEVHSLLHRMDELSVQAANDTNTLSDRQALQAEIDELVKEIDRISDTTTYNTMPIFKGNEQVIRNADGSPLIMSQIKFKDLALADISLGQVPFSQNSSAGQLGLTAVVSSQDSAAYGKSGDLVFGNGSTSSSSFRLSYAKDGNTYDVIQRLNEMTPTNYSYDDANKSWSRQLYYTNDDGVDLELTQTIALGTSTDELKNYNIFYSIKNTGSVDVDIDFMFHVDTAYNNDDYCEGYFIDGNRVNNNKVFTIDTAKYGNSTYVDSVMPDSLSIVDVENALAFSERIDFSGAQPDMISVGHYSRIREWEYYSDLDRNLGGSARREDLGFSLIWTDSMNTGQSQTYSLNYGIAAVEKDSNLKDVKIKRDNSYVANHEDSKDWWIQSGENEGNGMMIDIEEMNAAILGVNKLSVLSHHKASDAITRIQTAVDKLSAQRSNLGAWQNRLEHSKNIAKNIAENTQAAESQIRDTDMAEEMMDYAKHNILLQAGQSVLAQSNHMADGITQLLT